MRPPRMFRRLDEDPDPTRLIPVARPWVHEAGNPYFDWFFGGPDLARARARPLDGPPRLRDLHLPRHDAVRGRRACRLLRRSLGRRSGALPEGGYARSVSRSGARRAPRPHQSSDGRRPATRASQSRRVLPEQAGRGACAPRRWTRSRPGRGVHRSGRARRLSPLSRGCSSGGHAHYRPVRVGGFPNLRRVVLGADRDGGCGDGARAVCWHAAAAFSSRSRARTRSVERLTSGSRHARALARIDREHPIDSPTAGSFASPVESRTATSCRPYGAPSCANGGTSCSLTARLLASRTARLLASRAARLLASRTARLLDPRSLAACTLPPSAGTLPLRLLAPGLGDGEGSVSVAARDARRARSCRLHYPARRHCGRRD